MDKKIKKILYLSFDTDLTAEEKKLLEDVLAESEELRKEKEQLGGMRKAIASEQKENFKPFFADRVMQRIDSLDNPVEKSEQFFASLLSLFRPVAVIGATVVFILTAFNVYQGRDLSLSSIMGIYEESNYGFYETPLESFLGE